MTKLTKNFQITIDLKSTKQVYGKVTVGGAGYFWPNEEPENQYGYDIDTLTGNPLEIYKWEDNTGSSLEYLMNNEVMAEVVRVFNERPDSDTATDRSQELHPVFVTILDAHFPISA